MPRTIHADGRTITVPDDATPDEINQIVGSAPGEQNSPSVGSTLLSGAKDFVKGVLEGTGNTLNMGEDWAAKHLPPFFTTPLGQKPTPENSAASVERYHQLITPANTTQAVGKGLEQVGEFLLPTGIEEGAAKFGGAALGHGGEIAGKLLGSAAHSGAINKAQGGSATTGALLGAGGAAVGEGMKAAAPLIAESALGVRGTEKIRGRTVGQAIMDETNGVRPATVLKSAEDKLKDLNAQNENLVRAAGQRPLAPVRGLLQAPQYDVPLQSSPDVTGQLSKPTILQSNRAMPREFPHYGVNAPTQTAPDLGEIPGEAGEILPPENNGFPDRANGMGAHEYIGQRAGTQGGTGQPQGVLRTRDPEIAGQVNTPEPSATPVPYNPISLAPARNIASGAQARAVAKNLPGPYHTFGELGDVVSKRFLTGEPIPEQVSPMEGLELKRGIGDFMPEGSWNPESVSRIAPVRDAMYGSMMEELERAVPETGPLNQRISSLLPVTRRAEMAVRAPGVLENTLNRFRAPTGALTGMVGGGAAGYHEGGVPGAIAGAGMGALLPSVISSPTTQMILARGLYDGVPKLIPAATGAALQTDRGQQ